MSRTLVEVIGDLMPPAPMHSRLLRTIGALGSALLVACTEEAAVSRDAAAAMDLGVDVGPLPKDLGVADEEAIDAGADEPVTDAGRADAGRADAGFRLEVPVDPMGVPAPGSECTGDAGARTGDPTIAPPRPILPQSVSRVTSQRPSFRWALPEGTTGARVEVCADRCCTRVVASIEAEGTTVRPTEALPPGVVYWRMFGRRAGATGSRASYTWEFEVRRRDTPVDSSWGSIRDFTGDGYDDLALFAEWEPDRTTSDLYVVEGSPDGPRPPRPSGRVRSALPPLVRVGDFNGDGRADVAYSHGSDPMTILEGYAGGLRSVRAPDVSGLPLARFSSPAVTDWNGDGYSDVVVSVYFYTVRSVLASVLAVYHGSPTGLGAAPQETHAYRPPIRRHFVQASMELGDMDLDGYGDLCAGDQDLGRAGYDYFVIYGTGLGAPRADLISWPYLGAGAEPYQGYMYPGSIGDMDGDARPDFISAPEEDRDVLLIYRNATGLEAPAFSVRGRDVLVGEVTNVGFGQEVTGGDLNGDGFADLMVSASAAYAELDRWMDPFNSGRMYVFAGRPDGVSRVPLWVERARPTDPNENPALFGFGIASPGDLNGDGIDDAAILDPSYSQVCYRFGSVSLVTGSPDRCVSHARRNASIL